MFAQCKMLTLFLFIISPVIARRARELNVEPNLFILRELSAKDELDGYLASLQNIIGFCVNHKKYLDVNFAFGLLLINVHLKSVLKDENRRKCLPKSLRHQLVDIVSNNDQLLKYFKEVVMKKYDPSVNAEIMIATMFIHESKWIKRLPKFNTELLNGNMPSVSQFNKYTNWETYYSDVSDPNSWIPSPKMSDGCMASLSYSSVKHTGKCAHCRISYKCKKMIMNGTDFGYAFTHRLLILQIASFARGCSIFSEMLDKEIRNSICATAYSEAEFISMNDYGIVDLMLEIIGLCTLDGHAQFLRSSWLKGIQDFQSPYGCFSETKVRNKRHRRPENQVLLYYTRSYGYDYDGQENMERNKLRNGKCNGHVTAVAAASLSAAARFIIETYY